MSRTAWWFYVREGRQQSVHGLAPLAALLKDGSLDAATLVWCEGLAGWCPAGEVEELMLLARSEAASPAADPAPEAPPRPTPPAPPAAAAVQRHASRARPRFADAPLVAPATPPPAPLVAPAAPAPPAPLGAAATPAPPVAARAFEAARELAESDFPEVVQQLHERRASGFLELQRPGCTKTVMLQEGRMVFAASSDPDDRLGELLLRQGRITLAQYQDASRELGPDRRLGTVLVEQGAIGPAALVRAVIAQVQEIVYSLFQWTAGGYRLREERPDEDREVITLRLSTSDIIVEGVRRIEAWSRIAHGVGGAQARYARAEGWESEARQIKTLPDAGRELLQSFPDGEEVASICRQARELSDFEVCRLLWALKLAGLLRRLPADSG